MGTSMDRETRCIGSQDGLAHSGRWWSLVADVSHQICMIAGKVVSGIQESEFRGYHRPRTDSQPGKPQQLFSVSRWMANATDYVGWQRDYAFKCWDMSADKGDYVD